MPRLPDVLLKSVAFIFDSEEAVMGNQMAGGSAFLVRYPGGPNPASKIFLVTNQHVAQGKDRFVRAITHAGERVAHRIGALEWLPCDQQNDISVAHFKPVRDDLDFRYIEWIDLNPTPARLAELNVGVGDECFMLGRFVAQGDGVINQPLARFGNIALMPAEIRDGRGLEVSAYLVEMRSLSGFSGSPVFVHIGPGTYRGNGMMMPFYSEQIGILGIDTGHLNLAGRIVGGPEGMDLKVMLNTGVSIVAPSSFIDNLLARALARAQA